MEKKKNKVLPLIISILIIGVAVAYLLVGWEKTIYDINPNLDALIKSVFTIAIANTTQKLISFIVIKVNFHSRRNRTISTMIVSLLKYTTAIVTVIVIMVLFLGSQYMTELYTGLGVVALVIGLGCQSLISDIIAGIFMVFEGNYQVGDIVVINGWRGKVIEIGLRTTVIEDLGGNKKIINNSSISEIVNNSQADSFASVIIGIEYDQSLEFVENVISTNMNKIKNNIPTIIEGPNYLGIEELADSSVNLKITAKCNEEDKYQVQRDLNRQFKLLFDQNNISIPFPQVTISRVNTENLHNDVQTTTKKRKIKSIGGESDNEQS